MNLEELKREYQQLADIIELEVGTKDANLWRLCFQWWKVYKSINDQIAGAKDLKEKDEIITSFARFQEKPFKTFPDKLKEQGIDIEDIKSLNDLFDAYPPHMKEIILLMRKQKKAFIENIKSVKAEKEGKGGAAQRKLSKKSKGWLKS